MVAVPGWMQSNARRGLDWAAAGKGGAGLQDATIREARQMATGQVSAGKIRRMSAWFARHMIDLDSNAARPGAEGYPSPGVVAHALWGGGSRSSSLRAQAWADARIKDMSGSRAIHLTTAPEAIEVRSDGSGPVVIRGYAAIFDSPTTISQSYSAYNEVVARGAFRKTLQEADVRALYNHNPDNVLGRTKSGTLRLEEDMVGLRYEVQVPDTSWGRDLVELIRRGDVSQSSFAFAPIAQEWTRAQTSEELDTRTLKEVKLYDVSVVTYPAYEDTVASLRSAGERELVALGRLARGQRLDEGDIEQLKKLKDRIDDQLVEEAPVEDHAPDEPATRHSIDTLRLRLRLMHALVD